MPNQAGRRPRIIAIALGAAVLTSLVFPFGAAEAAPVGKAASAADIQRAFPDFLPVDPVVALSLPGVRGRVQSATGGVTSNVPVLVYEWPARDALMDQKLGQALSLKPLAATVTLADGSFRLPSSVIGRSQSPEKRGLLAVLADDATAFQEFEVSADGTPVLAGSGPSAPAIAAVGRLSTAPVAPSEAAVIETAMARTELRSLSVSAETASEDCGARTAKLVNRWDQKGIVGHSKSTNPSVDATFTYKKGSDSTLGWAGSVSGRKASYSQKGTKSITSTIVQGYGTVSKAHDYFYQSDWEYGRYELWAACGTGTPQSVKYKIVGYETRPIDFSGGTSRFNGATGVGFYCVAFIKGSYFEKDETNAMSWSNGVSINTAYIDVDLSSKSGWDEHVSISYAFTRGSGSVCGSLAKPGATASSPGDLSAK